MLTCVVQAYIQKLGTCLLEVDECQNEEAEGALTKLSVEAASLVCCLSHFNGDTVKALHGLRLDNGEPVQQQPGDAFYVQLVVRIGKLCLCSFMTKTFLAVLFTYAFMCVLSCCMYDTTRHVSVIVPSSCLITWWTVAYMVESCPANWLLYAVKCQPCLVL